MNKDLALKISKHPMIKKLMESVDEKDVARLIAEELVNEEEDPLAQAKSRINTEMDDHGDDYDGIAASKKLILDLKDDNRYTKDQLEELEAFLKEKIQAYQKAPKEDDKEKPASTPTELKPTLDRLANFLLKTGVLAESLELFFISLNPKNPKSLSDSFNENFSEEQIELLKKYFADKKNTIDFVNQYFENNQDKASILSSLEKAYGDTKEPSTAIPTADKEQPDKFDLTTDQEKNLKEASIEFINEFYEQQYLFQQGQIVKRILSVLLSIKSGEEKEMAAKSSKPREKIGLEEAEEDKLEASKGRLRSIQIAFRTFLQDIKVSKKALAEFLKLADQGSIVASSTREKFIKLMQRQQRDIVTLFDSVTDAYANLLKEQESKGSTELKWKRIEDNYEIASGKLRSLLGLSDDAELKNSILLIDDTIEALRELTKEFPNVNPFKTKDPKYDDLSTDYSNAVEEAKRVTLRPILELTRTGSGSKAVLERALEGLKEFSQQIATIFGVKSQFKDAPPPPEKNAPAAEPDAEKPKITAGNKITTGKKPPEATVYEEFDIEDLYAVLVKHKDTYEKAKKLIETGKLNEDKRLANLKKVEDEFDTQADNLSSSFGVYDKYGPGYKDSVKKAAQTFVDMYDELTQSYNILKDEKLGTQASDKLNKVFSSIENELDQMKKELEPATKDTPETTKKVKDKMYTLRLEALKQLSPKKFGEALGLANYSKERLEQYRSVFLKFLLALKHFSKNNLEEAQADTMVSQLKTGLGEFSREAVENSLNTLSTSERDVLKVIHGQKNIGELYKAVKPLYNSEKFSSPIDTTKAITPEFFSKGYVTVKGPKGKVDLPSITATLTDELGVEPEEAQPLAKEIVKAADDLGQQNLPSTELVNKAADQVLKTDAAKKIVQGLEEKEKVQQVIKQAVDEEPPGTKSDEDPEAPEMDMEDEAARLTQEYKDKKIKYKSKGEEITVTVKGIIPPSKDIKEYINSNFGVQVSDEIVNWYKKGIQKGYKILLLAIDKEDAEAGLKFKILKTPQEMEEFIKNSLIGDSQPEDKKEPDAEDTPVATVAQNTEELDAEVEKATQPISEVALEQIDQYFDQEFGDLDPLITQSMYTKFSKLLLHFHEETLRKHRDEARDDDDFYAAFRDGAKSLIDEMKGLSGQLEKLERDEEDQKSTLKDLEEQLEDLSPSETKKSLEKAHAELETKKKEFNQIEIDFRKLTDDDGDAREELENKANEVQVAIDELIRKSAELEGTSAEIQRYQAEIEDYKEKLKTSSDSLDEINSAIDELKQSNIFLDKFKETLNKFNKQREKGLEEQIANKLKPLIKEQLRRSK